MDTLTPQRPIGSGYGEKTSAREVISGIDLTGKTAVVTGGSVGMGLEIVKTLAGAGAAVSVPARSIKKAQEALRNIRNAQAIQIEKMDLMDPASIDRFAENFLQNGRPLHLLINNAGDDRPAGSRRAEKCVTIFNKRAGGLSADGAAVARAHAGARRAGGVCVVAGAPARRGRF